MDNDSPAKERAEVPEVATVTIGKVRYEAPPWGKLRGLGQNGGIVVAFDADSGRELWALKVYEIRYDGEMEDDKQDVFIAGMAADGDHHLRVEAERGRGVWRVDLVRRTSQRLP